MNQFKGRVLCVDDDRDTCFMFCTLLHGMGYEAIWATTVAEGLRLATTEKCDVIMLDTYLGDGTGIELCRMIRAFDPAVPIIFCSGVSLDSYVEAAKLAGAQEYFIKPCSMEKLERAIALLIGKKTEAPKNGSEDSARPSQVLIK